MHLNSFTTSNTITTGVPISFQQSDQTWTVANGFFVTSFDDRAVVISFNDGQLINHGHILSAGLDGAFVTANRNSILNTAGASITGVGAAIELIGSRDVVTNQGKLLGLDTYGVWVTSASDQAKVINTGEIYGRVAGVTDFSSTPGVQIINKAGVIRSDHYGIETDTGLGLSTGIFNQHGATIRGGEASIYSHNNGAITLVNGGLIAGAIKLDSPKGNDVIVNHGKIKGTIHFGNGSDTFDGKGGTSGQIFGDQGNDTLRGGAHADRIHGGDGNDLLTGRGGADKFFFDTALDAATNVDRITDFTHGVDKIELSAFDFAGIGGPGVLGAGQFFAGAGAHDANDHIIYNPNNGFLSYDSNGNAAGGVTHFATLAHHLDLHNTDFVVIA